MIEILKIFVDSYGINIDIESKYFTKPTEQKLLKELVKYGYLNVHRYKTLDKDIVIYNITERGKALVLGTAEKVELNGHDCQITIEKDKMGFKYNIQGKTEGKIYPSEMNNIIIKLVDFIGENPAKK